MVGAALSRSLVVERDGDNLDCLPKRIAYATEICGSITNSVPRSLGLGTHLFFFEGRTP